MERPTHVHVPDEFFSSIASIIPTEERLALIEKTQLFEWSLDTRRFDFLREILTSDFVFDHALAYRSGPDAFIQFWEETQATTLDGIRHQPLHIRVTKVSEDTALTIAYLNVLKVSPSGQDDLIALPQLIAHGIQTMTLTRQDHEWKIARITIDQMTLSEIFPVDDAIREYFAMPAGKRDSVREPLFGRV